MDDYSQPEFYRFNSDSLELVKFIVQRTGVVHSILDMGAGSGIIGIELARLLKAKHLTLLELQEDFEIHLKKNAEFYLDDDIRCDIILSSFKDFETRDKFDLIVSNPPYYLPGKGELPQDPRRARARSFLQDSWEILVQKMSENLKSDGRGYIILKLDQKLLNEIVVKARIAGLDVKSHLRSGIMILELLALNVDGNE